MSPGELAPQLLRLAIGLLALLGFLGGVYAVLRHLSRSELSRVERIMATVARAVGGAVTPGRAGALSWQTPVLAARVNDVAVQARCFSVPRRGQTWSVTARAPLPELQVRPRGLGHAIFAHAGPGREAPLGDASFDERFVVSARDLHGVVVALDAEARRRLLEVPDAWLAADGTHLTAHHLGRMTPETLGRLVALVGHVASR